jgi:hypothetical protein
MVFYSHDMNTIKLDETFFMGGNATFTVDNGKGTHYTFKIRQPKKQNPRYTGPAPHFISLLTGPDNENSYSYMGMVREIPVMVRVATGEHSPTGEPLYVTQDSGRKTLEVRLTAKSRYNDATVPVKVARWVLALAMTTRELPEGYAVHHSGHCGRCGRLLTHPESLKTGIGPECIKIMGLAY